MKEHFKDGSGPHEHIEVAFNEKAGERYRTQCKMISRQIGLMEVTISSASTGKIRATEAEALAMMISGNINTPIIGVCYCMESIVAAKQAIMDLHELLLEVEADAIKGRG